MSPDMSGSNSRQSRHSGLNTLYFISLLGIPSCRTCPMRPSYTYEVPSGTIRFYYLLSQYSAMSMPRMNSTLGWDLAYRMRRSRDDSRLGRPLTWGWRVMVMHVPYL